MKRFSGSLSVAVLLSLTACKGHSKKVTLYANGDIQVDNSKTNITVADGTGQREQELEYKGSDPVTLNITAPTGKLSLEAHDDGLYIANLKSDDTLIGSYQHVGAEGGEARIGQDALKQKLDSLQKLAQNQNVSEANKNYYILPNQIVRITSESNAKVFGPFHPIPGGFDAGSVPELYKFYSIREIREIITKLNGMTGNSKPAEPAAK